MSQIARALRWQVVIKGLTLKDAFLLNSANIFFNNLLPARTGELSWFYYANKLKVRFSASLWSFFLGRFFDLVALVFLAFLSAFFVNRDLWLLFILLSFLPLLFSFRYVYLLLPSWGRLKDLKDYVKRSLDTHLSMKLFSLSTLSMLFKFLGVYSLVGGDLFKTFLGFSGGELSSVLPIHSFMGYGTYELGFSLPYKIMGESVLQTLPSAFLVHNFLLISSFMLGLPSVLLMHLRK